jgi:hypothetical protein
MLPVDRLEIAFAFGEGDDDRTLVLDAGGPGWSTRLAQLEASC